MDWGVAQKLCDNPLQAAMELAQKLGSEQALARTLAKTLIDARVGAGGGHEESLRCERIAEGLLYEAKHKPRAVICGIGTAAPEERYTQKEVANLLQVNDPRLRAIYSAAHIESRRLAEIGSEQAKGTTQGQLLNKHVRWAKQVRGHMHTHARASTPTRAHAHTPTRAHAHTHTCAHAPTPTPTHTHMRIRMSDVAARARTHVQLAAVAIPAACIRMYMPTCLLM